MRVTSVELHPANSSNVFALSFRDPRRGNPYNIKGIDGLSPDIIVPKYYGTSIDGDASRFYNLTIEKRTLVMLVELNPVFENQSYSNLRDELYKMISTSRTGLIEVQFKDGDVVVAVISGRVTKFESSLFTQTPEVQLTFDTDDPWLKAPNPVAVDVSGIFDFNFSIPDLVSTAPHGFDFEMGFTANRAVLTIADPGDVASWSFTITPAGGFLIGDILHFSSDPKDKKLYIVRAGNPIYLADKISPGSVWPIMFPGDNNFVVLPGYNAHGYQPPADVDWTSFSYYPTYWGV